MILGKYGNDQYGLGPYGGSVGDPFGVSKAASLGFTTVRVTFNDVLDATYVAQFVPSNFGFSPGLTVLSVVQDSPTTLLLTTSSQIGVTYTVTVTTARAADGRLIDITLQQTTFRGFGTASAYRAVATSPTRVRAVFFDVMLNDANFSDPTQYTLTDLQGTEIPVASVVVEQASNPTSVVLLLSSSLTSQQLYQLEVSSDVKRVDGTPIIPPTTTFQWVANLGRISVPVSSFSGEVQNGLYGVHNGLVFFSPALQTAAANSIIQVDEIDVCTKAYDQYHPPQPIDPPPLFTHGGGITPTPNPSLLNETVLWANFPRLSEAKFILGFTGSANTEAMPQAADSHCVVEVGEPWDTSRVALLNGTAWSLFDNTGLTTPPVFITADNLTPIPPGAMTTIVLQAPP